MIFNPVVFLDKGVDIKLASPTNLTAEASSGQVSLKWTDPVDLIGLATWKYTRIVRKQGSNPNSAFDGELVVESGERNQYQSTPYVDTNVTNGVTYYYGAFAFSDKDVPSDGAFANATPIAGTPLSELAEGTLIKINENGSPVEYQIVNQGLPSSMYDASCDGCWVLRKDIAEEEYWDSTNNDYKNSDIQDYLNDSWLSRYSAGVLSQIKQVKIPYVNGTGSGGSIASGANGLSCKIFLLSGYEVGWSVSDDQYFPRDGAKLSYFSSGTGSAANNKRIANYNGSATNWWLRSPFTSDTNLVWSVYSNGSCSGWDCGSTYGVRPALILPSTALVDADLTLIES